MLSELKKALRSSPSFGSSYLSSVSSETQSVSKTVDDTSSVSSLYVPNLDVVAVGESPSLLLGLSTPPLSQRATPAASILEQSSAPGKCLQQQKKLNSKVTLISILS